MDDKPGRVNLFGDEKAPPANPAPELPPDASLEEKVIAAIKTCYDPEIPLNIYELGLIYELKVDPAGAVAIKMTLTSPACPVAGALPREVEQKVAAVPGVSSAKVELVWDPPWDKSRMSEAAKLQLGIDDW
jgi:FeS assembly SUF system protein